MNCERLSGNFPMSSMQTQAGWLFNNDSSFYGHMELLSETPLDQNQKELGEPHDKFLTMF